MRISDWSSDVCSSDLPADALSARVLFVRYEQLIGDTEAAVQRLSAFCDLSLTSADLAEWGKRRRQASSSDDPLLRHPRWSAYITGLSGGPIPGASIRRHREVLGPSEADKIDEPCADLRQAFGYGPANTRPCSHTGMRARRAGWQKIGRAHL